MKIKVVIEDLKIKKNLNNENSKNISRIFSGVVAGSVGSVHFQIQAPSYVVHTNYRVLIYRTCHLQGGSLSCSFFCLLVSSVSNFHPGTRRRWWTLFQVQLISHAVGRDGCCKQITLACVRSVSATLGLPSLTACVLSVSTLVRLQVALPGSV